MEDTKDTGVAEPNPAVDDPASDEEEVEVSDDGSGGDGPIQDEPSWLGGFVDTFIETTEMTLSAAASTIREGVSETVEAVTTNLVQSEFYKNNLAYVPPEDAPPSPKRTVAQDTASASKEQPPNEAPPPRPTISQTAPDDYHAIEKPRMSGFFSLEEDMLSQVEEAPLEDRIQAAGQSIGYLKVGISEGRRFCPDGTLRAGTTLPYLRIRLGRYQLWTSPIAKEDPGRAGRFFFNRDITLVAQDVNTDLIVEVRQKNVLLADSLIGQVLIPLTSIIPDVRTALSGKHERCEPYKLSAWFELFPLKEGRRKFRPASHDIAGTGMWKKTPPLGYIHLDLELHLHGRISMWAGYAMPASDRIMDVAKPPMPSGDLKAISAVVETGRGFKRNFQRVKVAFARLFSRGKYTWAPLKFVRRARTFEELHLSAFVLCSSVYICLLCPPYLLPTNLYLILLASVVTGWGAREDREYMVWNQDIRDPDDELGSIQKVAKVIYLLEKFERWMGIAADLMERIIHMFSFADERVTIATLLAMGVSCVGFTIALFLLTPGYLFFLAFNSWFLGPIIKKRLVTGYSSIAARRGSRKKKSGGSRTSSPRHSAVAIGQEVEESLRGNGRLAQSIAVLKLVAKTPSLARNVFARVPTEDELGHRWISKLQRLPGEPPADDTAGEEEEDAGNGGMQGEQIWFAEL